MIQPGDRFNRLVAVRREEGRGNRRWLFRCDCGNEKVVLVCSVKMGRTKSCGCFRNSTKIPSTIAGARFGYWTAISFVGRDEKGNNPRWLFRCDCGTERVLIVGGLKYRAELRSCGCLRRPTKEKQRVDAIYKTVRRGSVKREIPFEITKLDIQRLADDQEWKCSRTGIDLDLTLGEGRKPFGPTIDRIDSSRGYTSDNIQLVCNLYNYCKNEYTDADVLAFANSLVAHASRAVNHLKKVA